MRLSPNLHAEPARPAAPAHAEVIRQAGMLLVRGRPDEALGVLRDVLARDPRNVRALHDAGRIHAILGETDAAIDCFQRVLACDAAHAPAFYALMEVLMETEAFEQATDLFVRHHALLSDEARLASSTIAAPCSYRSAGRRTAAARA